MGTLVSCECCFKWDDLKPTFTLSNEGRAANVQQTIRQKSKNEMDNYAKNEKSKKVWALDSKTMELVMDIDFNHDASDIIYHSDTDPTIYTNTDEMRTDSEEVHFDPDPLTEHLRKALGGLNYDFKTEEIEIKRISKDLSCSNSRLQIMSMQRIQSRDAFVDIIADTYMVSDEPEEIDVYSSSYEEPEILKEIERMKSNQSTMSVIERETIKGELFRPDTVRQWNKDEMHVHMDEMMKEMEAMKEQHSVRSVCTDHEAESGVDVVNEGVDDGGCKPSLFRDESDYKWDEKRLVEQNKHMQAHLVHLMQTSVDDPVQK